MLNHKLIVYTAIASQIGLMNKHVKSFKNIVYDLSRINEWWLLSVGMILFAFVPNFYVANNHHMDVEDVIGLLTSIDFLLAVLIVYSAQIFLFASNDYFDRDVDALDPHKRKRNPVCNGDVTLKGVRALLIVSGVIPFIASLYFGTWALIYTALAMFVFYFYTAPPLRFKNKVGLDVLSHSLFVNTFPYFFCIVALNDFTTGTIYLLAVIMMRSAMAQMFQEIRDYEIDRQVEKNTVVVLGQRRALWVVVSIYLTLFSVTAILLASYQLFGWGIEVYYSIILIICISYIPIFYKLTKSKDLGRAIERLWMGQGRTNTWQAVQYVCAFALYFVLLAFLI
jgi:4-hydroxybenzoate polyprenyltransferase